MRVESKKPWLRIPYEEVRFVWVSSHYDVHLAGLCRVGRELARFAYGGEGRRVRIYRLTRREKLAWLLQKWLFEFCVGRHWTYPDRKQGARFTGGRFFRTYCRLAKVRERLFRLVSGAA